MTGPLSKGQHNNNTMSHGRLWPVGAWRAAFVGGWGYRNAGSGHGPIASCTVVAAPQPTSNTDTPAPPAVDDRPASPQRVPGRRRPMQHSILRNAHEHLHQGGCCLWAIGSASSPNPTPLMTHRHEHHVPSLRRRPGDGDCEPPLPRVRGCGAVPAPRCAWEVGITRRIPPLDVEEKAFGGKEDRAAGWDEARGGGGA